MNNRITRRDFLKLAGLLPLSIAAPQIVNSLDTQQKQQNVLIIVFDALSAYNISLYGYQRETTPNLARLAERAVVYHNHYANGNFTTPGTASLLTGTLPWMHRAFPQGSTVDEPFIHRNIFTAFRNYYRLAYSHNVWVYPFLNQFRRALDEYIPLEEYLLESDVLIPTLFRYDSDIATLTWNRALKRNDDRYAYSLFLSGLYEQIDEKRQAEFSKLKSQYPRGIPKNGHYPFLLEQAVDSVANLLAYTQQPFMGYFHFYPPHNPYNTHKDFYGRFEGDGYRPVSKPLDGFHKVKIPSDQTKACMKYDEFILYVDREFSRLYNHLSDTGLLDNTWIVLTSDHGEMFERGIIGHSTHVLYEPVIRVPLMIFEPGRKSRTDVYSPTSSIDLLPTLLHVTGQQSANWTEGIVLPPFSSTSIHQNRNIYTLSARNNEKYAPLNVATIALIKDQYKLMYFFGYDELVTTGEERIELYNLKKDPEELNNLYQSKNETGVELLNELKAKLAEVNQPYL